MPSARCGPDSGLGPAWCAPAQALPANLPVGLILAMPTFRERLPHRRADAGGVAPATGSPLSEREQEVLRLVADGLTNEQIAQRLIVSIHTVHRHVANIRLKLNQPSRGVAASYAVRHELI